MAMTLWILWVEVIDLSLSRGEGERPDTLLTWTVCVCVSSGVGPDLLKMWFQGSPSGGGGWHSLYNLLIELKNYVKLYNIYIFFL